MVFQPVLPTIPNPLPIRWQQLGLMLSLMLLVLGGCTNQSAADTEGSTPASGSGGDAMQPAPADGTGSGLTQAQYLPVGAIAALKTGEQIQLEVATTPQQQALGLMYREPLPADRGMVFPFSPPRPVSFWMRNVPVPLDMVFVYQGKVQAVAASAPPCEALPCPTYGPGSQPVDYVIELRSGRAEELNIAPGDPIEITWLDESSPNPES